MLPEPAPVLAPIDEPEFDIKKFLRAVIKRLWILIAIPLPVITGVLIYNATLVPVYRATALLMIELPQTSVLGLKETQLPSAGQRSDYYNTQYEVIKSIELAKRVSGELNLNRAPEFRGATPEIKLPEMITVEPVKNSQLVKVSVDCENPKLAARIVNTLAELYMKQNLEWVLASSKEMLKTISGESQPGETKEPGGQSDTLSSEKIAEMLPSVAANPALAALKSQKSSVEFEITDLSKRYKAKHPKMILLNSRLESLNAQIKTKTEEILSTLKIGLGEKFRINNVRIVDKALVPQQPLEIKKISNLIIGAVFSILLSLGIIMLLERMDKTVKTKDEIQPYLRIPLLGNFPLLKDLSRLKHGSPQLLEKIEKNMHAATAIRGIRTGLTFSIQQKTARIITLTSAIPKEGKSFIAAYLAFSFAKNGAETLLIDGDLRLPVVNHFFGVNTAPGLGNLLSEEVSVNEAVIKTGLPKLSILPAGKSSSDPAELFGSPKMAQVLRDLSGTFDKIIIDAPPSLLIPDAMVLSKVADATILIVKSGMVELKILKTVKDKFDAIGSSIMGFILNGLDPTNDPYYDHYFRTYTHLRKKEAPAPGQKK